ncbi:odorant receptor 22b [Lasius niger]|uniref:Odorant receptor 22b n=1 Tax=Lasius niger TaxID=67767 RepID=A0A0J7K104_LASNI|nr:odorant receptor 22b [Lasius niger]
MVVTLAFLVKLLNQLWNRSKFRRLYETMENHWNIFTNDIEVRIMKNYSGISQKFTVSYSRPMLLDIVLPLNESRPRHFAVYAEYGIDQNKYFVVIFLYTTIMITVGMTIMVAADTMHIACTAHACSLFQVIGQQIENVISNVHEIDKTGYHANAEYELLNEKLIYRKYIVCLKKHQLALE